MHGQLHSPAVFSRRKSDRHALEKTPAELQQLSISVLLREKYPGVTVLILLEILLAVSDVEHEDRRADMGPTLFHYLMILVLKTVSTVYYYMYYNILKWGGEEFFPLLSSHFAQVFLSVFSFSVSVLSLVLIEMSQTEAAVVGFMNCTMCLRDITEPFRKFVRIQTKWNDRKTQNAFMSSLRAH
jgi:hypothetical protein